MVGNTAPKRWRIAVDALAVLTALALALATWGLYSRFQESNAARQDNKHTWHAVICSIEQIELHNPALSEAHTRASLKFWDGVLTKQVGTTGCGYLATLPRR